MSDWLRNMSPAAKARNAELLEPTVARTLKERRGRPEGELQDQVITDLEELGYLVFHPRAARTAQGWVTPVEGTSAAGYPDITAVHPSGRCVVAELKAGKNRPSDAQLEWLRAWMAVPGVTVLVVRPENWDELRSLL